ncbi:metallopeptidase family protein [uncultured Chloroflexus sp.]|uniref:metallopeptidase family protein n=1 Tax=uncultured Chloroflexus sp. TaxID=214040 RepID=UPI0026228F99|nr:metallopeptidase family protein [uncultured Chloroflexus sp.]
MEKPDFANLVAEVIASLPPAFARHLEMVEVVIAPRPSRDQRRALGLKPWQTIYGLYEGVPLTDEYNASAMITIFQEPLERDFRTTAALREQVRRTVLHEIAHHFGISDERLRELGAY